MTSFPLHHTTIGERDDKLKAIAAMLHARNLFERTRVDQFDFNRALLDEVDAIDLDLHKPISLTPGTHRFRSREAEAIIEAEITVGGSVNMRRLRFTDRVNPEILGQALDLLFGAGTEGDATRTAAS
jgi:hypothetical protein